MHLHFLLLQKWPQSPWIDSQADDIGKWKEPWLSHIAYRGHFFRFRHPYLHWTGIFDLLWDSPNVPFMGHCLWSQSHFIHDFRLHANVLHIHAFQDQHQQKQSKVLSKWMLGSPESTYDFGINIGVRLLIFEVFSRGYVLIKGVYIYWFPIF